MKCLGEERGGLGQAQGVQLIEFCPALLSQSLFCLSLLSPPIPVLDFRISPLPELLWSQLGAAQCLGPGVVPCFQKAPFISPPLAIINTNAFILCIIFYF